MVVMKAVYLVEMRVVLMVVLMEEMMVPKMAASKVAMKDYSSVVETVDKKAEMMAS